MNIEYGFITSDLTEKEILKHLNAKLKTFFTEIADAEYAIYRSYLWCLFGTVSKYEQ